MLAITISRCNQKVGIFIILSQVISQVIGVYISSVKNSISGSSI
jgi:hypothetical protein